MKIITCLIFLLFSELVHAQQSLTVNSPSATLYDAPRSNAKEIGSIAQGKKVIVLGEENGYYRVQTKSGRAIYIHSSQLESEKSAQEDIVLEDQPAKKPRRSKNTEDESSNSGFSPKLTYDLSVSTGSYNSYSYTEAELGLNLFFLSWLAWRNGFFARFVQPENYYGVDSSLRAQFHFGLGDALGATVYGGPGYRFQSKGEGVPMAEGGLNLHLVGFSIGGGVKTLYYKAINQNRENDTQYYITLSAGGSIF